MPNNATIIPEIPISWISEEAPWSEELLGRFRDGLKWLHGSIAGLETSSLLQKGTVDANPVDGGSTSTFTDSNPTDFTAFSNWGHLYVPDLFEGLYIEIVDGAAAGDKFRITEHDLGTGPTDTAESNFTVDGLMLAAGVLAGDQYRIMGHAHNNFGSEQATINETLGEFVKSGDVLLINGFCPTGYTRLTSYDNRALKNSNTSPAGTNGGVSTHTHTSGNSGDVQAGATDLSTGIFGGDYKDTLGGHNHIVSGISASGNNDYLRREIRLCTKD